MVDLPTDTAVLRIAAFDTATLSDALDRLGITGQCHRIQPCDRRFRLAGRAFTLLFGPAAQPAGTVGDFIDDVPPGGIVLIDAGGREDATIWGDILTEIAHRRGVGGTVIDGINRDVALCLQLGYPVYSRGVWMRTGKDRIQIEGINVPVTIGGARAAPGDLVRGDADGVIVVPREHEERVLEVAAEIEAAEESIRQSIRGGMRLDEARRRYRYHKLQSRS